MQNQLETSTTTVLEGANELELVCKVCSKNYDGMFCPQCGQKYIDKRINMRDSIGHLLGTVFNFDKGLWHTSIELMKNPGKLLREYLNGITTPYFHPFRFLFLWLTLQVFFMVVTGMMEETQGRYSAQMSGQEMNPAVYQVLLGLNSYMHILIALSMPVLAAGSRLLFRKSVYNYAEHLVINCFAYGETVLVSLLLLPLFFVNMEAFIVANTLSFFFSIGYLTYVYISFFGGNKVTTFFKALGVYLIWFVGFSLIIGLAMAINIFRHPETIEALKNANAG